MLHGGAALVLRTAVRVPDTSDSPSLLPRVRRLVLLRPADATCATLCTSVLPVSHCVHKLRGQIPITQQSESPFFGTTVQSDHAAAERKLSRDVREIGPAAHVG